MNTSSAVDERLRSLEFDLKLQDPRIQSMNQLRDCIQRINNLFVQKKFKGVLFALTHELVSNAFKAMYKRQFYQYLLTQQKTDFIPEEKWIGNFQEALEAGNLDRYITADRSNFYVQISGRLSRRVFTVEVRNPGVPSRIELARIETFIRSAPRIRNESDAEQLPAGEGGGMGLRLIAMTLQGMGLRPSQFQMLVEDEHTVARIHFPLGVLYKETVREKAAEHNIGLLPSDSARDMYLNVARAIDLSMLRFDVDGNLLQTTENFLDRHKLGGEQRERIGDLLPAAFYENLFVGPDRVAQSGVVHNYRVTVPTADRSHFILYNVNGCMTDNRFVDTTWQMVTRVENRRQLSEGFLDSNVLVSQIIRPYIHPQALEKAREIARKGDVHLPDEVKEATIFFSDLVDFTRHSESLSPEEVISLLNIAIGICVRSIDKNHGNVDKFLGDGIMAIFPDPLEAVVAAFEIQQQFSQLNEFRELQEQPSIRARTGIHTGSVVIGSVGTKERRDWTVIGDVVNTAARIEQYAEPGSVVISAQTYQRISDHVQVERSETIQAKGKSDELNVYFLDSVRFMKGRLPVIMTRDGMRVGRILPTESKHNSPV